MEVDQLASAAELGRTWTIGDQEARAAINASEVVASALAHTGAESLAALGRVASATIEMARLRRRLVEAEAGRLRQLFDDTNKHIGPVWSNTTGELLKASPPDVSQQKLRAKVIEALDNAVADVSAAVTKVKAELGAILMTRTSLAPWTDWVSRSADVLTSTMNSWPDGYPFADDGAPEEAIQELERATAALGAVWRNEEAPYPPPPPAPEEPTSPSEEALRRERHVALLKRARPHSRVDGLAWDPQLHREMLDSLNYAASLTQEVGNLTLYLDTAAGLTHAVTKNAPGDVKDGLVDQYAAARPLCAGACLLREILIAATSSGDEVLAEKAQKRWKEVVWSADWSTEEFCRANRYYLRQMLLLLSTLEGETVVRERVSSELEASPDLLPWIVLSAASRHTTFFQDQAISESNADLSDPPSWLPAETTIATYDENAALQSDTNEDPADWRLLIEELRTQV